MPPTIPALPLPEYFQENRYNTGSPYLDNLPLITMLPCLLTLNVYRQYKRWADLVRAGLA